MASICLTGGGSGAPTVSEWVSSHDPGAMFLADLTKNNDILVEASNHLKPCALIVLHS